MRPARANLYRLGRELVALQRQAGEVARLFKVAMHDETRAALQNRDIPALDPQVVELLGTLDAHANHVRDVIATQEASLLICETRGALTPSLARRLEEAWDAGELEARLDAHLAAGVRTRRAG